MSSAALRGRVTELERALTTNKHNGNTPANGHHTHSTVHAQQNNGKNDVITDAAAADAVRFNILI